MNLVVHPTSSLYGTIQIPASKSQTVRALLFALLAEGTSEILNSLLSEDTEAALRVVKAFGGNVHEDKNVNFMKMIVEGQGGRLNLHESIIDVGNSGITGRFSLPFAGLIGGEKVMFVSGAQLQARPMKPLINALNDLGMNVRDLDGNGSFPIEASGTLKGGQTAISGLTSQFLSSLLMNLPLAPTDSEIHIHELHEKPYVEMTLKWLDDLGIRYDREDDSVFRIPGGQGYKNFSRSVPGDFSSASYPIAAAVMTDSEVTISGLDFSDPQGDKRFVNILQEMGADINVHEDEVHIKGGKELRGGTFDLNDMPDMLPTLAVIALWATSPVKITNVPQARIKETDRIHAMATELMKMGANIHEYKDGLEIEPSLSLRGTKLHGYHDHRTIMALSLAGLIASGETEIDTAEGIRKTFPNYVELMRNLGANFELTV